MKENKGFFSFAFDSAHVKYGVWTWPQFKSIWTVVFQFRFIWNVRRVNRLNKNAADIFILDKLDRTVYNRSFDNPLSSFVDIFAVAILFIIFFITSILIIKVPIFFPQPFYVSLSFSPFLIATVFFLRLDIILIYAAFIYFSTNCQVQHPKSEPNSQDNQVNQAYKANEIFFGLKFTFAS